MPLRRARELPLPAVVPRGEAPARRRPLGALHGVAFRLRPGDGQGPRAYLDRQPYFQQMPRFLVIETAIHWIDTFRFLMGEVDGRLRAAAARQSGDRRRGCRLRGVRVRGRRDAASSTATASTTTSRRTRAGRWARCGSRATAACCGSTATRGCGGSRITATKTEHAYDRGPDDTFGGGCCEWLQRHVVAHLRAGAPVENTARDYLANLRVQEAVYRIAAATRRARACRVRPAAVGRPVAPAQRPPTDTKEEAP